ncbi:MAG: hypothetical protein LBS91_02445 [Clostridiales Family XIII bacterium]|jgi:hypothetical protein|nr:hypothetical protein [Clostridiales Family XIII bacterium]
MDFEELLALLDIDAPSDLVYFEQFADLMEQPRDIPPEALAKLIEGMEADVLSELTESYFEDILKFVPDDESELYTLLSNISTTLSALAQSAEDDAAQTYAEELFKFRAWYLIDSRVICTENSDGTEKEIPLMEALTNYRLQNFTHEDYSYDFSDARDYPLEEYIVSLGNLLEDDYGDGDIYGEDEDYRDMDEDEE